MIPEWVIRRITGKIDNYFEPLLAKLDRICKLLEDVKALLAEQRDEED